MTVLRFLNNTSLFVSIGALFTYVFGVLICQQQIIVTHALNAFFLTWCAYQFINPIESRYRKVYMVVACTGACINFLFLPLHFFIPVITGIALTLFYKNDWRGGEFSKSHFSLRGNGWTKTLATAMAWTIVTSWWMFVDLIAVEQGWILALPILSQFLWIGGLALAGDLRDVHVERDLGATLPAKWGRIKTCIVCSGLFILSCALVLAFMRVQNDLERVDFLLISAITVIALLVTWRINPGRNWQRLTSLLDGLLILKGICAFLCLIV
ncbi:MAG: hypothetical protein ACKVOK_03660 [Flavobacteriales bacterium]